MTLMYRHRLDLFFLAGKLAQDAHEKYATLKSLGSVAQAPQNTLQSLDCYDNLSERPFGECADSMRSTFKENDYLHA